MRSTADRFIGLENAIHLQLVRYSPAALRIALGAVYLGFGLLKFFPGVSPAEDLLVETIDAMTFGVVPDRAAIVGVATLECFIGLCLLAGRWLRVAIWLLAVQLIGVLAPLVLLTGRLFDGPGGAPTLEGQYVLKDLILIAAAMVVAAASFRGGRMVRDETPVDPD